MSRAVGSSAARFAVLLAATLVLWPAAGFAQDTCEASLRTASDLFSQGKFDAARQAALPCLDAKPTRVERSRTLALLARIFLVQDDLPAAEATVGRLLAADPDFQPDIFDSPRFMRLLTVIRGRSSAPTVTSVSKAKEPLAEAPATVAVITGADIERRGYTDLEAVLRDLPGFDFSRRGGPSYSNIYQRGYRSIETNRTMLLIDGVEDNDLASSTAWLSRQFPLSNIDRIEVVYGPASTMYGANAFAGVINVVTKQPEQIVAEGKRLGGDARMLVSNNANVARRCRRRPERRGQSPLELRGAALCGRRSSRSRRRTAMGFQSRRLRCDRLHQGRRAEPDVRGRDRQRPREVHRGAARALLYGRDRRGGELDRHQADAGRSRARPRAR